MVLTLVQQGEFCGELEGDNCKEAREASSETP